MALLKIFAILTRREKYEATGIFLLMVITALIEMLGIGSISVFIALIAKSEIIHQNQILKYLYNLFSFSTNQEFLLFCGGALFLFIVVKNSLYFLTVYVQQIFLIEKRIRFTSLLFEDYLSRQYIFHLENNSATLFRNLGEVDNTFSGILQPLAQTLTEILVTICVIGLLLYSNFYLTIGAFFLVGGPSCIFYLFFQKKLKKLGEERFECNRVASQHMLEGLGCVKEIQLMDRYKFFSVRLNHSNTRLGSVRKHLEIINSVPKLTIEIVIFGSLVVFIMFLLRDQQALISILPTIGLFSVAAFRLMGSINRIVTGLNAIKFNKIVGTTVGKELLNLKRKELNFEMILEKSSSTSFFKRQIEFQKVSYCYPKMDKEAINKISVVIPINRSVAFVGSSGTGKTTLINLFLGLLQPSSGKIFVDGLDIQDHMAEWRKNIGYIPQTVYLCDDTLRHNIAFGLPDELIDDEKILAVIELAQLGSFVQELPHGVDTFVGEHGARISGGQRQRIAIARALYQDPSILVMDEATSSLDGETEANITNAIQQISKQKTLIIIAHRLSTIKNCDCIFFMENGKILDSGNFEKLYDRNTGFRRMLQASAFSDKKDEFVASSPVNHADILL